MKEETSAQVFSCGFAKIVEETFFIEQLRVTAFATALLLMYNF